MKKQMLYANLIITFNLEFELYTLIFIVKPMGFKANIDIALSFSNLKFCSVRQQGQIKFRICLYYTLNNNNGQQTSKPNEEIQFCHPYSILRKTSRTLTKPSLNSMHPSCNYPFPSQQSQLDLGSDYYISKPFRVMFEREVHHILETCCFRISVDIQRYQDVQLKCQVELLFCPNSMTQENALFKIIGKSQCKVRKVFDISAYLPIVFDQFQGVVIEGVYQAALIDFKYQRDQNQKNLALNPENFHEYLKKITNGFNRAEVRNFYKYYRQLLQKQLFAIQQRHYDLVRVMGLSSNNQYSQFRILRINQNSKIDTMIDHLGGYNSHQNPYFIGNKKNLSHNSTQSLSTSFEQREGLYKNRGIITRNQHNHRHPHNSEAYKQEISQQIMYDFLEIKALIYKKWSSYLQFTTNHLTPLTCRYRNNYNSIVKERLSGNVFSHRINNCQDWRKGLYEDSGKQHMRIAETDRKKLEKDEELWKEILLVQNVGFFLKDAKNIKIFEEIYPVTHKPVIKSQKTLLKKYINQTQMSQVPQKRSLSNLDISLQQPNRKNSMPMQLQSSFQQIHPSLAQMSLALSSLESQDEDHFIILVHGFQASRQDFILIKNCLEIRFKIKVYISTANQGRTDDDIELQGKRLALELQKFLNDSAPSVNYRLSFLGHSMGGIIVRTALCYLENIEQHLYSYISFSTPHLGYLYQPSTHIQAGLWLLSTIQKTPSLQQLSLKDNENPRASFLYRLSRSKSLNNFKNIALVGSHQDKYVPYQSARVEYNEHIAKGEVGDGGVLEQMIDGILGGLHSMEISRMDVIFSIEQSNFDTMIGRTAHIRYLSDRQFIKVFFIVFDKFFK